MFYAERSPFFRVAFRAVDLAAWIAANQFVVDRLVEHHPKKCVALLNGRAGVGAPIEIILSVAAHCDVRQFNISRSKLAYLLVPEVRFQPVSAITIALERSFLDLLLLSAQFHKLGSELGKGRFFVY